MTDKIDIAGVLEGSRTAQRDLYKNFLPYVLTVVRRYGVAHSYEPDVVQECFAEVFRTIAAYEADRGTLITWIRTISVRRTIDFLRRQRIDYSEMVPETIETGQEADDLTVFGAETLITAIKELPPGYRLVFNLYAVDGYAHAEIATLLGIDEASSRSQYSRARKFLRQRLHPHHKSASHVK